MSAEKEIFLSLDLVDLYGNPAADGFIAFDTTEEREDFVKDHQAPKGTFLVRVEKTAEEIRGVYARSLIYRDHLLGGVC